MYKTMLVALTILIVPYTFATEETASPLCEEVRINQVLDRMEKVTGDLQLTITRLDATITLLESLTPQEN